MGSESESRRDGTSSHADTSVVPIRCLFLSSRAGFRGCVRTEFHLRRWSMTHENRTPKVWELPLAQDGAKAESWVVVPFRVHSFNP